MWKSNELIGNTYGQTHGLSKTGAYKSWKAMMSRCYDPRHQNYKRYNRLGITVCDEWRESPENFIRDLGERPEGHTLDRRNNLLGYFKNNCWWRTPRQQALNRSDNVIITYKGKTQTLTEWSEELGFDRNSVGSRILNGWNRVEAMLTPFRIKSTLPHLEYNGLKKSLGDWCRVLDLNYPATKERIFVHRWSVKEAFETPLKKTQKK